MTEVGAVFITGAAAALVAIWGVVSHRAVARRSVTLAHLSRWEADGDLIAATHQFIELAKAPGGLAAWAGEDKEKSGEVQSIRLVLNQYELVSIGIQRGIIDPEIYKRWHRSGTVKYWEHAAPFVTALRGRLQNDAIYHEFEELARWMKANKMPKRNWWWGRFF